MKRPFSGAALWACVAALVGVVAAVAGAVWARGPAAGYEGFVARVTEGALSEALFLTAALLATGLGLCALVQILRDRRRRGLTCALVGSITPWFAWVVLDRLFGG